MMGSLKRTNPKWIRKRSWFEDLKRFDLGDNFFEKVFEAKETSAKDKKDFVIHLMLEAKADLGLHESMTAHEQKKEFGFAIEDGVSSHEKEEHESLLGYEWWIKIYNLAKREDQFTKDQIGELETKRKYLFRTMNAIELLSG
jgi:hypothetical protein